MAVQAPIQIVLSNGQRAGQTIKELTQQANRLKKELNSLKPGSEEFVKKTKDFQQVTGRLKQVRGEVNGVNTASRGLLGTFSQFLPFSGQLSQITTGFSAFRGAVGGTTKGFQLLKVAIASTGIGLLLVAIGSLVAMFKSSEEGQDRWNKIMKVGGVIIGNLSDVIANIGDLIFKAFSNPQKTVKDLWEVIKTNFLNRIRAVPEMFNAIQEAGSAAFTIIKEKIKGIFGAEDEQELKQAQENLKGSLADLGESFLQATTGVDDLPKKLAKGFEKAKGAVSEFIDETAKEVQLAQEVADLEAETNRLERQLLVERTKIEAQIAELRLKARQEDEFSAKQRKEFLQQANVLQEQILEKDEIVATNRLRIQQLTNSFSKSTRENLEAEAQAEARLAQVQVTRFNEARQIEREFQRVSKQQQREEKALQKEKEDALKKEAQIRKNIQDLRIQNLEEGLEKEMAIINKETEEKIKALEGSEAQITEQRLLLEQLRDEQIREMRREKAEEDLDERLERMEMDFESESILLEEQRLQKLITEEEFQDMVFELHQDRLQKQLDATIQFHGSDSMEAEKAANQLRKIQLEHSQQILKAKQDQAEKEKEISDITKEHTRDTVSDTLDLFGDLLSGSKKSSKAFKFVQRGQIIADGIREIQGIWRGYATSAIPQPAASILAGVQTGIAAARSIAALAKIDSVKFKLGNIIRSVQKYSLGGLLKGALHSQGGIPGIIKGSGQPIEMEDGEIVLNRKVGMDPAGLAAASELNARYGGIRFLQSGGPVNPFSGSSAIPGSLDVGRSAADASQTNEVLVTEIRGLRNDVSLWQRELKVTNNVNDTRKGIDVINKIEESANF